jgi:fatty acid desaturase
MLRAVAAVHFLVGVFGVVCALLEGSDWWVGYATALIASAVGLLLADIAS